MSKPDHELPSWTATLSDLRDAKGERSAAIVPPDGLSDAQILRAAARIIRKHMKAKGKETFTGLVFVRVLERRADKLEAL